LRPKVAEVEQTAELTARGIGNDDGIRCGKRLQACREIGRFTDDRLLLRRARADQVADDHQPGGDADAHLQRLARRRVEPADGVDDLQTGAHGAFGLVLVGARIAEIGQQPIAHELGDEAVMAGNDSGASLLIGANHFPHVLGIEPCREGRRTGQIAEQDRQLPSLGFGRRLGPGNGGGRARLGRCRQRRQHPLPVAQRQSQLLQIVVGQRRDDIEIDAVVAERRLQAGQSDARQPFAQGRRSVRQRALHGWSRFCT
jgi:hypothetical protein